MALPPRHTCVICGEAVYLDSSKAMAMATVWMKNSKSRSVAHIIEKHYKYCHDHCYEMEQQRLNQPQEETLF